MVKYRVLLHMLLIRSMINVEYINTFILIMFKLNCCLLLYISLYEQQMAQPMCTTDSTENITFLVLLCSIDLNSIKISQGVFLEYLTD